MLIAPDGSDLPTGPRDDQSSIGSSHVVYEGKSLDELWGQEIAHLEDHHASRATSPRRSWTMGG